MTNFNIRILKIPKEKDACPILVLIKATTDCLTRDPWTFEALAGLKKTCDAERWPFFSDLTSSWFQ